MNTGAGKTDLDDPPHLFGRMRHAATRTAQGIRRPDDHREADLPDRLVDLIHVLEDHAPGDGLADGVHQVPELLPVFSPVDRLKRGAEDLHALQRTHLREFRRHIEAGLAAHAAQDTVRLLLPDDLCNDLGFQGLDVDDVRGIGVGLDRRGVRVDEDDLDTLFPEGTTGLRS